jgi:hypothetical protein
LKVCSIVVRVSRGISSGWALWALTALAILATPALLPAPAEAGRGKLQLGTADPLYVVGPPKRRAAYLHRAVESGVDVVRLNAYWFKVAPKRPRHPRNPSSRAYKLHKLDAAVRAASERGLRIFITLQRAPEWAEMEPNEETRGAWKPRVKAFGDFAHAIAKRYSGSYPDPRRPGKTLPRVRHYQAWNEGNLHAFLAPQVEHGKRFAVDHFRRLVNRAYREIKAVDRRNRVIAGGSAPVGPSNSRRTDPITFWRKVFCLKRNLHARPCPRRLHFDIFDHHPINTLDPPRVVPKGRVVVGNYGRLRRLLRAAERHRTVRPANRKRPMWATEVHWETNPPDAVRGKTPRKAARYLEEAIYLLWKQGASLVVNFYLVDPPLEEPGAFSNIQGGLYFLRKKPKPKPSLTAFRFPLVADKQGRRKRTTIWGRAPISGLARISVKRHGTWRPLAKKRVRAGKHFRLRAKLRPGDRIRARVGTERSLVWRHRR